MLNHSTAARRGIMLAEQALVVALFISSTVSRLYSQAPMAHPTAPLAALNQRSCDLCTLLASENNNNDLQCLFSSEPAETTRPLVSGPLRCKASLPLTGITLFAQNQQVSSMRQNPTGQSRKDKTEEQSPSDSGSPGHIFWVVPAFKVDYGKNFTPLTVNEKFHEWARGAYDPLGLGALAAEAATLEHSSGFVDTEAAGPATESASVPSN